MNKEQRLSYYKCSMGLDMWHIGSAQIPDKTLVLSDGPCGVRQEDEKTLETKIATSTPCPAAIAASFDKNLAYRVGKILASDCSTKGVDILLAPGVNIKRSPLCGRNFEYFSEDPFLSGRQASEYIKGVEEEGVGTCVKHFVANNKEWARKINSSEMSLRTLNEIYLKPFSYVFEYSTPTSLMTSYNKVNGEYVAESDYLINDKLRKEFGFKGLIMSDWNAVSNKPKTIKTGLNVQMPFTQVDSDFLERKYNKEFTDKNLIANDNYIKNTIYKFSEKKSRKPHDFDKIHKEVVDLSSETQVLVKNENNYLPFKKTDRVLVLGYFGSNNRNIGLGSGWVNAYNNDTFVDVLHSKGITYDYIRGWDEKGRFCTNKAELSQFKNKVDKVVLFLGSMSNEEGEGFDRKSLEIQEVQKKLFNLAKTIFKEFAVVFISGSVYNIKPYLDSSSAMIINYLCGEGQSEAIYNNLFGLHNPSGRLPETWITNLHCHPLLMNFIKEDTYFEYYNEDIYVGYRYYLDHRDKCLLPFGFGLSYSKFSYKDYSIKVNKDFINITFKVKNESNIDGSDVVQIYVGKENSRVYRSKYELMDYEKIYLKKKEVKTISINIPIRHLAVYETSSGKFKVENGIYQIYINKNAFDIIHKENVQINGVKLKSEKAPVSLKKRQIPEDFSVDSPLGLINVVGLEHLYKFYEMHPVFDLDFALKLISWNAGDPLRSLIKNNKNYTKSMDSSLLEEFVNYLNKQEHKCIKKIHHI